MITADQLKDVTERAEALHHYLNIDQKKVEFEEEQLRTQAPDFWEDVERAQAQMKKVKGIEKWINGYNDVKQKADELQLAFDFYKDELVTEEEVDADYAKAIKAIEDAGSTDTTAIRDALKNVEIDGVTGNITFNETGDANKDIAFIKTIKDGRFQFLTTTTVE